MCSEIFENAALEISEKNSSDLETYDDLLNTMSMKKSDHDEEDTREEVDNFLILVSVIAADFMQTEAADSENAVFSNEKTWTDIQSTATADLQSTASSMKIEEYIKSRRTEESVHDITRSDRHMNQSEYDLIRFSSTSSAVIYFLFQSETDYFFAKWLMKIKATKGSVDAFFNDVNL